MKIKSVLLIIILIIISILCIDFFRVILYPISLKIEDGGNKGMEKFHEFYNLERNTIDIVFLGSSHSNFSFIPMVINEKTKTDSYTLGTHGAHINIIPTYLREVVKYQDPKIVTIELFTFSGMLKNEEYIEEQQDLHNNIDCLKFSFNKLKLIYSQVEKPYKLEHVFPISVNHAMWKDESIHLRIGEYLNGFENSNPYFGYEPSSRTVNYIGNDSIYNNETLSPSSGNKLPDEAYKYLDEITEICRENDIELIFVLAPMITQSGSDYNRMLELVDELKPYADENSIEIIDYILISNDLGLCKSDLRDPAHLNTLGAMKISNHFSQYVSDNYSEILNECTWDLEEISKNKNEDFLDRYKAFDNTVSNKKDNYKLSSIAYQSNMQEYIGMLDDERYITIISTKNNYASCINGDIKAELNKLGLDYNYKNNEDINYIGISNGIDKSFYIESSERIEINKDDERLKHMELPFELSVISSDTITGSMSSIKINNKEYSKGQDGFNIVVYDKSLKKVISEANFDLNRNLQHYSDIDKALIKYDDSKVVYTFDTQKVIKGLEGASGSDITEDGIIIKSNSDNPNFQLIGFNGSSNHILLKAEIICPQATWFEVEFGDLFEREQLVTGENTIYIEMKNDEPITSIRITPANSIGDFLIKSLVICDLNK